jgi:hypothetical protein
VKASARRARSALRARRIRHRGLQQPKRDRRRWDLLARLAALTPDEATLLWYRLGDMALLEQEDLWESLEQMRRGEGVTLAEYRASDT